MAIGWSRPFQQTHWPCSVPAWLLFQPQSNLHNLRHSPPREFACSPDPKFQVPCSNQLENIFLNAKVQASPRNYHFCSVGLEMVFVSLKLSRWFQKKILSKQSLNMCVYVHINSHVIMVLSWRQWGKWERPLGSWVGGSRRPNREKLQFEQISATYIGNKLMVFLVIRQVWVLLFKTIIMGLLTINHESLFILQVLQC